MYDRNEEFAIEAFKLLLNVVLDIRNGLMVHNAAFWQLFSNRLDMKKEARRGKTYSIASWLSCVSSRGLRVIIIDNTHAFCTWCKLLLRYFHHGEEGYRVQRTRLFCTSS